MTVEAGQTRKSGRAPRVTIIDVARAADVSKSTVSLVLTGSSLVADATRERVIAVMSELGYIYHRGAASLRGLPSGVIGMVINDLSNPFFVELAIGIEESCQGSSCIPFLANVVENPLRQLQVIRSMREHGAMGLVLSPAVGTSAADLKTATAGMPVVQVMRRVPGFKASLVAPDNREGARVAVKRLIAAGHTRIAFAGGSEGMIVREDRLAGYRQALEEAGLAIDEGLILPSTLNYSGGGSLATQLVSSRLPATAALCYNDVVAIGLVRGLTQLGVKVGTDFAVIGFDDIEEARHTLPALTTVAVNGRHLGVRAAQLLMRHLSSGDLRPENVICPTQLVVRGSCGTAHLDMGDRA